MLCSPTAYDTRLTSFNGYEGASSEPYQLPYYGIQKATRLSTFFNYDLNGGDCSGNMQPLRNIIPDKLTAAFLHVLASGLMDPNRTFPDASPVPGTNHIDSQMIYAPQTKILED